MRRQDGVDITFWCRRTILSHVLTVSDGENQRENKPTEVPPPPGCSAYLHFSPRSIPHHCGAQEVQHLPNRISKCDCVVGGEEQTNCARIWRNVLNHDRSRVARPQESVRWIIHNNLSVESFVIAVAIALTRKGYSNGCVQTRNPTARQPARASAFFHVLIQRGRGSVMGNRPNPKDGAVGPHHSANNSRDGQSTLLLDNELRFERCDGLCEISVAVLVDQSWLNN